MRESEKQRKEEVGGRSRALSSCPVHSLTPSDLARQEKRNNSSLKIYEKGTASSKIGNIRRVRADDSVRPCTGTRDVFI